MVTNLSLSNIIPLEILSVKSDNLFGPIIEKMELNTDKIRATIIKGTKLFKYFTILDKAIFKSFGFSATLGPGPTLRGLVFSLFIF